MLARAHTAAVVGIEAQPVVVEVQRGRGLPGIALVGLARGAVREASVRVRAALGAVDCALGSLKLTVNLLPAELPKEAAALDLPLALALMVAAGRLPAAVLEGRRFYGELSLGGELQPARGAILVAALAREAGDRTLVLPAANVAQARLLPGLPVLGARHLAELAAVLVAAEARPAGAGTGASAAPDPEEAPPASRPCLSEVAGQARAKEALVVAAAGGHHLLMIGPPGSGKSMLARRLPSLLPPLGLDERVELTRIMAASGAPVAALATTRPFRAPHHQISAQALCGGGSPLGPGEVTLAHLGVLFLDELAEFDRRSLQALREPLEEGVVWVSRVAGAARFPSRFQLVAATNPCPCGHFGAAPPARQCVCSLAQIEAYRGRVGGPFRDRMDLCVWLSPVPLAELMQPAAPPAETSQARARAVLEARRRQLARQGRLNAHVELPELRDSSPGLLAAFVAQGAAPWAERLSSRGVLKLLRVARTLLDLEATPGPPEAALARARHLAGQDAEADAWAAPAPPAP